MRNTSSREGDDVVQLYIHDPVASISQPVRRLRGFQRVTLKPGETQPVTFTLDRDDFGFYDNGQHQSGERSGATARFSVAGLIPRCDGLERCFPAFIEADPDGLAVSQGPYTGGRSL